MELIFNARQLSRCPELPAGHGNYACWQKSTASSSEQRRNPCLQDGKALEGLQARPDPVYEPMSVSYADFDFLTGLRILPDAGIADISHAVLLVVVPLAVRKEIVQHLAYRGFCREQIQIAVRDPFGAGTIRIHFISISCFLETLEILLLLLHPCIDSYKFYTLPLLYLDIYPKPS